DEAAWFLADTWQPRSRLTVDYGARLDHDSVTGANNLAPRAGASYALTSDNKTILKADAGLFYDRVILNVPVYPLLPGRLVTTYDSNGRVTGAVTYRNALANDLQNPRSASWNVELDRQVMEKLAVRVSYQQRNSSRDFVTNPIVNNGEGELQVGNGGMSQYR